MDYHFFPNILFKRFIASENSRLWFEGCLKMISSWEAWEKVWESSEVSKLTSWFILWEVLHWKLFFICYTRWSCTSVSDVSLLISLFAGRKSCQNHRWKTGSWILRDVTCSRKWLPFLYRWSWQRERGRKKSVQCTNPSGRRHLRTLGEKNKEKSSCGKFHRRLLFYEHLTTGFDWVTLWKPNCQRQWGGDFMVHMEKHSLGWQRW